MRKTLNFLTALALSTVVFLPCFAEESNDEAQQIKKMSKAFGFYMGQSIKEMQKKIAFDVDQVIEGIRAGYKGGEPPMTQQEYEAEFMKLRLSVHTKEASENLTAAQHYLAEKKKEKGVKELVADKLYYEVLTPGKGEVITEKSLPTVHYEGKFIDGSTFSSSTEKEPFPVDLNHVIAGFKQGLMGAKVGEKRRLYIHPELAYGDQGNLPPNSLLIFDVEIIKIEEAAKLNAPKEEFMEEMLEETPN